MINSTSAVELGRGDVVDFLQPPAMMPEAGASLAHPTNALFLPICSNDRHPRSPSAGLVISEQFSPHAKDKKSFEIVVGGKERERVRVQHLQTHSRLQNNHWTHHSFCGLGAERDKEAPSNNNNNNNSIINNQNESALKEQMRGENEAQEWGAGPPPAESGRDPVRVSPACRTEDQENAFRRIEDVHNYSKLNRYSYSNGSSNSSVHEDEEEDEEEEEEGDDEEDEALDQVFEPYHAYHDRKQPLPHSHPHHSARMGLGQLEHPKEVGSQPPTEQTAAAPDHHARRPMNAFLIFCKRHRAIVKDRYRSFENRAITKILGDWWASLDAGEKKCYTNLAQQNKDAFFSANPNFKWYKLPAPPLRTLHTRPGNSERLQDLGEQAASPEAGGGGGDHVFKFADETQMGDLSALMVGGRSSCSQSALQQALGETTQFISAQMPDQMPLEPLLGSKRRLHNDHSFSSNSSEEDLLPKKSSRSCKGKIYQELVNSGQIAAITKKTKAPKLPSPQQGGDSPHDAAPQPRSGVEGGGVWRNGFDGPPESGEAVDRGADRRKASESSHSPSDDLLHFDLEERIRELPALSLDAYLQRKRSTKKKKKINAKKRNTSTSSTSAATGNRATPVATASPPATPPKEVAHPAVAVGSQKRKARKESITRRDISAIESEVAEITCSGRYFYNDSPAPAAAPLPVVPSQDPSRGLYSSSSNAIASTSDLLILAEVAAKRTEISN